MTPELEGQIIYAIPQTISAVAALGACILGWTNRARIKAVKADVAEVKTSVDGHSERMDEKLEAATAAVLKASKEASTLKGAAKNRRAK